MGIPTAAGVLEQPSAFLITHGMVPVQHQTLKDSGGPNMMLA